MENQKNTPDAFIKDEGYADVHFLTDAGKEFAHELEIPNQLAEQFEDTFCGEPIWKPETKIGVYSCAIKKSMIRILKKEFKNKGLIVESEF